MARPPGAETARPGAGACEGGGARPADSRGAGGGLRGRRGITLEIPQGGNNGPGEIDPLHPAVVGALKRWWRWVAQRDQGGTAGREAIQRGWLALVWLFCDVYDVEKERRGVARAWARAMPRGRGGEVARFPQFFVGAVGLLRAHRWGRAVSAAALARALRSGLERSSQLPPEILNVSFQDARERFALETSFVPVKRRQKRLYRMIEPRLTTAYQKTVMRPLHPGAGQTSSMRRDLGLQACPGRPAAAPDPSSQRHRLYPQEPPSSSESGSGSPRGWRLPRLAKGPPPRQTAMVRTVPAASAVAAASRGGARGGTGSAASWLARTPAASFGQPQGQGAALGVSSRLLRASANASGGAPRGGRPEWGGSRAPRLAAPQRKVRPKGGLGSPSKQPGVLPNPKNVRKLNPIWSQSRGGGFLPRNFGP